jgi:hypothetical protein
MVKETLLPSLVTPIIFSLSFPARRHQDMQDSSIRYRWNTTGRAPKGAATATGIVESIPRFPTSNRHRLARLSNSNIPTMTAAGRRRRSNKARQAGLHRYTGCTEEVSVLGMFLSSMMAFPDSPPAADIHVNRIPLISHDRPPALRLA